MSKTSFFKRKTATLLRHFLCNHSLLKTFLQGYQIVVRHFLRQEILIDATVLVNGTQSVCRGTHPDGAQYCTVQGMIAQVWFECTLCFVVGMADIVSMHNDFV